jgi:hypothetical protein
MLIVALDIQDTINEIEKLEEEIEKLKKIK